MIVTHFAEYDRHGKLVRWMGDPYYDGPVAECKKGREAAASAAGNANKLSGMATNIAHNDVGKQDAYAASADPFAKSLVPGTNGALSPYAASQYEQDKRNIAKNYGDVSAVGIRNAGIRGMGGAPTGLSSSITNTAGRNAGEADTNAYNTAQQTTLGAGLKGIDFLQGQEGIYDPIRAIGAGTGAAGTAAEAAAARNKMGSGLGDAMSAGGALAGIAAGI